MTAPGEPRPPRPMGLQRERTVLSWNRTLLTLMVVTALVLRAIGPPYPRLLHVPGIVILLAAVWLSLAADVRYRRNPSGQRVGAFRHLLALWLCAVAMGVGGIVAIVSTATAGAARPPVRATATASTLFDTQRTIRLVLVNDGGDVVTLDSLRLDSPLFEAVDTSTRSVELLPHQTVLVPLPYGPSRCPGSPDDPAGAVVVHVAGEDVSVDLEQSPRGLLVARRDRECAVAAARAAVDVAFADTWTRTGPRAADGAVVLTARGDGVVASVASLEGNVVFGIDATGSGAAPLAGVGPARREDRVPVTVSADRCDTHAMIESKRTFVFTATVVFDEVAPVVLDVEPTGAGAELLRELLEACLP